MYKYLSDSDYFLVMVKIFEKYSYIKKKYSYIRKIFVYKKITHKNIIILKKLHDIKQEIINFRERNYE